MPRYRPDLEKKWKDSMKRTLLTFLMVPVLICIFSFHVSAVTELEGKNNSYIFNYWDDTVATAIPYTVKGQISLARILPAPSSVEDITVDSDGEYYAADRTNSCIYVINPDLTIKTVIKGYEQDNTFRKFNACEGVWCADGKIYIANTADRNIVILDRISYKTLQIIKAPTSVEWSSDVDFEPFRLSTDNGGRIYVISRNQTQGVVQFSKDGKFIGYLGALNVKPNAWDIFIRTFGSKEMKSRSLQMVPTEFTNLTCTEDGMVFAITETVTDEDIYNGTSVPVRLLNPLGNDILKKKGYANPIGDIDFSLYRDENSGSSRFVDVAIGPDGVYSICDGKREKVFTYDRDGNLLYVFGEKGSSTGKFSQAVSLVYNGNDIAVLDKATGCLTVFEPTNFALKVLKAYECHNNGDNPGEIACWKELQQQYKGYDLTSLALGKVAYNQKNYKEAMNYFKAANNKNYYSKALKGYQSQFTEENLVLLFIGAVFTILLLIVLLKMIRKWVRQSRYSFVHEVEYSGFLMTHPFNGFWGLKSESKGSVRAASVILIWSFLVRLISERGTPYLFCNINLEQTNSLISSLSYVAILFLWVVSNWCFTTLFDGKGTIKDIYIYTCYSLIPYALFTLPVLFLGHLFTLDSASLYSTLNIVIMVYCLFLLFTGTLTVHQFSLLKTIAMMVLSVAGIALLIFLIVLCGGLIGDIYDCIVSIIKEITLRY